jgi:signal transduction histidine kinase/CheY-like chemotaxis protein
MENGTVQVRRSSPLARKHALVWSVLVGLLMGLSGLVAAGFAFRDTVRGVEGVQREKATAAADRIRHFIDGIEQPLRWLANDPARDEQTDLEPLQIEMLQLLRRLPVLTELRWIDAQGRERLLLSRLAMDSVDSRLDLSGDPRFTVARRDGEYISPVSFQRGTEPHIALALATRANGPVLTAEINLKAVWDITRQVRYGTTGIAYVVDAQGQLLSHPDLSLVLRRTDMAKLAHVRAALATEQTLAASDAGNLEGVAVLAASSPVPRLPWTVVVEQHRREALAPVWRSFAQSSLLVLLGVLLAVVASTVLARRLARPIRALQDRAAAIAAGRLDQRIDIHSGDELQSLAEQFNRMAANLQATYASLESRVAERTRELAEANQAKSRFLAAASHDLRQPVHALGLFVGQLGQSHSTQEQHEIVRYIEASVASFESLLESLLDISRLDAGTVLVRRDSVALGPLLTRLGQGFEPTARAQGLQMRVRCPALWVDSDAILLERILLNLLGNAIRYTERGGVLIGARRRGATVEIVVADTGIGIEASHLPQVFREFYRAPGGPVAAQAGLGLGLAIVERLARLLNHALRVQSRPGQGTCFTLTAPLARPPEMAPPPATLPPYADLLAHRRVLVIDDDAAIREAMRGQLRHWGCEVRVADGETSALLAASELNYPELVITDLRLNVGEDGLTVARRIAAACPPGVAIAVLTGETDPAALQAVRDSGLPLLTKPLRPARLRALIEVLLGAPPPD